MNSNLVQFQGEEKTEKVNRSRSELSGTCSDSGFEEESEGENHPIFLKRGIKPSIIQGIIHT